jgi:hypothetical protein
MEEPMMRTGMKALAFTAFFALAAAACEDGATDNNALDDAALRADAALVAADAMFQDLAHMESPAVWAGTGFAPEASGIEFEGSKTFSRTVTFFDGADEEQSRYDPESTARMHIVADLTREVTHTFWSAEIEGHREMDVTGLEGPETERTWNGTTSGSVKRSRHPEGGTVRYYDMTNSGVITDVVRGVPRADNPYPKSGTITRTIHAEITVDGEKEVRDIVATITFDGDNTATITVDGESWEINLDDRNVNRRFQRGNG